MSRTLWLKDEEVAALLDHQTAYRTLSKALQCHAEGAFCQPLKPYLRPMGREGERTGGRYIAMPAYLGGEFARPGIKWIASRPANVDCGIPRASGIVILNSPDTGEIAAIMECRTLSARRTAAVAAISFDLFAPRGPRSVGLLGAGPIGQEALDALAARDRNIACYQIFDPHLERAEALAGRLASLSGVPARAVSSSEEAVRGANVTVCATTGAAGYVERDWIQEGALLVALSLDDPTEATFLAAKVVTDDWDQANREEKLLHRLTKAGVFSREKLYGQLGEVLSGRIPPRTDDDSLFLVAPMGMAIEDIAVAHVVLERAVAHEIGQYLN